ncbi:single-stranded DNA-binding protein [Desulforhabdus amnigena]|jgi:single-strand DNA-binding protein|uniref:Single-stranded DNA-binding protein n=1 Tax=Desulforhabdus amnigena TaxID=40218 RepID=A0A9W6LAF9_9BACT|nr:single-stranded DNA-binding protein [Desulforhabdus amnigena]NLJ29121.1 single-stranded DNA-binding protein [Deltaproteobacteria bacterium]GLI36045.1 single-stranded DNA-binding protein 1 [Desulforhabdus amnigena]
MAKGTVNKVILIGRLGADPDIRYSANGTAIAKFNVATNDYDPSSETKERTEWHRVVAFGKLAEICGNYLGKGRQVFVEGNLRTQQWEDAQGVKRYTTEIVAREIQFLGGGADEANYQAQGRPDYGKSGGEASFSNRSSSEELPPPAGVQEEDIPF